MAGIRRRNTPKIRGLRGANLQGRLHAPEAQVICDEKSLGLHDLAAAQAGSADAQLAGGAVHNRPHRAQVHVPAPPAGVVGATDGVAKLRPLAADITYACHEGSRMVRTSGTNLDFTG